MNCPKCAGKTKVLHTYHRDETIKRTRICIMCQYRFFSIEAVIRPTKRGADSLKTGALCPPNVMKGEP